jgi:hypothetical protein
MAKIQLTIKTDYLPKWGAYEGVRELVQNAKDAEVEHSAPMTIDWYNDTLRIENEGTTLPLKALLLGHTTKLGNSEMIGKFGEGLKLGVLALVRAGHDVKIRNGEEVWIPTIERDDRFDDNVLTFKIEGGREQRNRVRIEIGGISKEAWAKMKDCFLFINKPKKNDSITTYNGSLLLGPDFKGRIYVKGIFVQTDPDAAFGYDLKEVELDRDRKMVESWNLKYHTRKVFLTAMNKKEELFAQFTEMLTTPTTETESMDASSVTYDITKEVADKVADHFRKVHGPDAVPVASLADSKDIEHFGKKGIVVSKPLGAVLAKSLGDALTVKENLKKETLKLYSWSDLTEIEQSVITGAVAMINEVETFRLDDIDVVDFRSVTMDGQFKDSRVLIAKKHLASADETLKVLVHEVAHRLGSDGSKSHVQAIEELWTGIVRNLRNHLGDRLSRIAN